MTARAALELDIFSDPICPWCYIGKRRLERALAQRPNLQINKRWRAFQLNPEMPLEGMDREKYLSWKFGGSANAQSIYDRIARVAGEEGLSVDFTKILRTPNTRNAHRLVRFTKETAIQDRLVETLFQAYFVEGRDIGLTETLCEIGEANGLNSDELRGYLISDKNQAAVVAEDAWGRDLGIQGVPCFVLQRSHGLSGAHPPEVLVQMLDLAEQNLKDGSQD